MKKQNESQGFDQLISALFNNHNCRYRIPNGVISNLIEASNKIFANEPSMLELHPPITICGDIHGQFPDLLRIFQMNEKPPNQRYLFLGDYVDRGPMGLEVICLLLALKVKYPNHVYLLRGNHETREVTEEYGFSIECTTKANRGIFNDFCNLFEMIPIAALISNKILCVHGGLTPSLTSLNQIREIVRPADASYKGFLADLLWSDPSNEIQEWGPNPRGDTVMWGRKSLHKFLEANGLTTLIRAHQMVMCGYEYPFEPDRSAITVFSAPCYAGEFNNKAAFLLVGNNLEIYPVLLPHEPGSMSIANKIGAQPRVSTPNARGKGGRGSPRDNKKRGRKH
ncbi:Ser/Thr protein phosphatase [Histomonas meleagridis]|uniref:Ser/Thr protein phosphatase n=1 Tax=Histomonas meleagridis TaxID=135588 RepID=UPI00355A1D44|nr:Ser/Thr protein phosphatase [Histomonas meleagridis]KAH0800947.1 Ser/Thr protein phosphatase [Histomonas meleagridis]